jgi:hypothetical protein
MSATVVDALHMPHAGLESHTCLWTDVKCADLVRGQTVVTVNSDLTVENAADVGCKYIFLLSILSLFI